MRRLRSNSVFVVALALVISMTAMMTACSTEKSAPAPQAGVNAGPDGKPAPFREPVRLSSKDGVLEVRLSAHQGTVNLDTVKEPVTNFLIYGYRPDQGHQFGRLDQGRQPLSGADAARRSRRTPDRPLRQRPCTA